MVGPLQALYDLAYNLVYPVTPAYAAYGYRWQQGQGVPATLEVYDPHSSQAFFWEVKATRQDGPPLDVEPSKGDLRVSGIGPYRYGVRWPRRWPPGR